MRIGRSGCLRRNRGHVKAAGGEFEHSLNLLTRHMKLLDDFLYARTCLKIFKNRSHGHPRVTEHPRAAALPRNALHGLALRPIEICHVLPPFMVAGYVVFYHGWAASSRVSLPKKLPHPNPHFHRIDPWIRIAQPRIRNMQIPQLQTKGMFIAEQMHPQRSRGSKVQTRSSRRNLMIGEEYPTP